MAAERRKKRTLILNTGGRTFNFNKNKIQFWSPLRWTLNWSAEYLARNIIARTASYPGRNTPAEIRMMEENRRMSIDVLHDVVVIHILSAESISWRPICGRFRRARGQKSFIKEREITSGDPGRVLADALNISRPAQDSRRTRNERRRRWGEQKKNGIRKRL